MSEQALTRKEQTAVQPTSEQPSSMIMAAIANNADPQVLARLMDLQDRYDATQARKAFTVAMAQFKASCPAIIGKDKSVNYGAGKASFKHASIGHLVEVVTPHLSANGLSIRWETSQTNGHVEVTCIVEHEAGHREQTTLTGPRDESGGKNPIQTVGSSVTYLQRYTLVSALGLATADQDDMDEAPKHEPIKRTTPKAQPQAEPSQSFVGIVDDVKEIHSKADAPKPWTKWGVVCGGETYGTFDRALGEDAIALKGCEAVIEWKTDGKYKTLTGIKSATAQDDPEEQLPL